MKKLARKTAFLFDLDGTLYLGKKLIPGALELVWFLHECGKDIFYFTNNSSRSEKDYVRKMKSFGFPCRLEQVVMSTHSLIRQLKKDGQKKVFCLGTPAMKRMLKAVGIEHTNSPRAIVIGFDKTLTYQKWLQVCRWIDSGIPYYVTHPDFFCPTDQGPEPDCGAIALATEKATGRKPKVVLGKPHPLMIQEVARRKKIRKSEMLLIGDRLHTDILMAQSAKIESLLVLTGETKRRELKLSKVRPSFVMPSVASLHKTLQKLNFS